MNQANYGLIVQRKPNLKVRYRIVPYVELRVDKELYNDLRASLLLIGVNCNYHNKRLHIQGIQNCLLISQFIDDEWFRECLKIFRNKEHTTRDGITKLLALRDKRQRPNILRTSSEEVSANL